MNFLTNVHLLIAYLSKMEQQYNTSTATTATATATATTAATTATATTTVTECVICAEKMNRSTRNPIGCQYCDFVACRTCIQTYILSEPIPKCMNAECGREWTRYFLARHFPKSFMSGKYRSHISMVLFDAEKALLPDAQNTVELMKRVVTLTESIHEIDEKMQG